MVSVSFILLAPKGGCNQSRTQTDVCSLGRTLRPLSSPLVGGDCVPARRALGLSVRDFAGLFVGGRRGVLVGSSVLAGSKVSLSNLGLPSGTGWLKLSFSHLSRWPQEVAAGPIP